MNQRVIKVNGTVTIEERVSKQGNVYQAVFVTMGDKKVQVGFLNAQTTLAFIRAGLKELTD